MAADDDGPKKWGTHFVCSAGQATPFIYCTVERVYGELGRRQRLISQTRIVDAPAGSAEMKEITMAMQNHLQIVGQMHFVRLEKLFPRRIADVTVGMNLERNQKIVIVKFKNGYTAEAPEFEAASDLFTARCAMIYDLPPSTFEKTS